MFSLINYLVAILMLCSACAPKRTETVPRIHSPMDLEDQIKENEKLDLSKVSAPALQLQYCEQAHLPVKLQLRNSPQAQYIEAKFCDKENSTLCETVNFYTQSPAMIPNLGKYLSLSYRHCAEIANSVDPKQNCGEWIQHPEVLLQDKASQPWIQDSKNILTIYKQMTKNCQDRQTLISDYIAKNPNDELAEKLRLELRYFGNNACVELSLTPGINQVIIQHTYEEYQKTSSGNTPEATESSSYHLGKAVVRMEAILLMSIGAVGGFKGMYAIIQAARNYRASDVAHIQNKLRVGQQKLGFTETYEASDKVMTLQSMRNLLLMELVLEKKISLDELRGIYTIPDVFERYPELKNENLSIDSIRNKITLALDEQKRRFLLGRQEYSPMPDVLARGDFDASSLIDHSYRGVYDMYDQFTSGFFGSSDIEFKILTKPQFNNPLLQNLWDGASNNFERMKLLETDSRFLNFRDSSFVKAVPKETLSDPKKTKLTEILNRIESIKKLPPLDELQSALNDINTLARADDMYPRSRFEFFSDALVDIQKGLVRARYEALVNEELKIEFDSKIASITKQGLFSADDLKTVNYQQLNDKIVPFETKLKTLAESYKLELDADGIPKNPIASFAEYEEWVYADKEAMVSKYKNEIQSLEGDLGRVRSEIANTPISKKLLAGEGGFFGKIKQGGRIFGTMLAMATFAWGVQSYASTYLTDNPQQIFMDKYVRIYDYARDLRSRYMLLDEKIDATCRFR